MSRTVVFIDTETTGIDPLAHEVWEFAYIKRTYDDGYIGGYVDDKPVRAAIKIDESLANPFALEIGRYYERSDGDFTRATFGGGVLHYFSKDVLETLQRDTKGALLCGWNVHFDAAFLKKLLNENGLAPRWDYHFIDLTALCLGQPGVWDWALANKISGNTLAERFGVPELGGSVRHTALGDSCWARDVFDAVISQNQPGVLRP